MKKNCLKRFAALGAAVVMGLSLAGCGSAKSASTAYYDNAMSINGAAEASDSYFYDEAGEYESASTSSYESSSVSVTDVSEKLIVTYDYDVETKQFDEFMSEIQKRVAEFNGYMEDSSINGNSKYSDHRSANLKIRIPKDRAKEFVSYIEGDSNVTYSHETTQNVTLDYVDIQSHLEALEIEKQSLMDMLENATELETIFMIQSELTDVRYRIQSYESQLRVYDNKVSYTTITLDVREVERETVVVKESYWDEVGNGFMDTLYEVGEFFKGLFKWFVVNIPVLLLLGIIALVVVLIIKKTNKRSAARKAELKAQKAEAKVSENKEADKKEKKVKEPTKAQQEYMDSMNKKEQKDK